MLAWLLPLVLLRFPCLIPPGDDTLLRGDHSLLGWTGRLRHTNPTVAPARDVGSMMGVPPPCPRSDPPWHNKTLFRRKEVSRSGVDDLDAEIVEKVVWYHD